MITRQTFGSALQQPWAMVRIGCNCPVGRRPATQIVYLTDDEGDHYLGGVVNFHHNRGRLVWVERGWWERVGGEPQARWHFSYARARRFPKSDVVHIFRSTDKSMHGGPTGTDIRRVRKALPITTVEMVS